MRTNIPQDKCPHCGRKEVEAMSPRTYYACGSSDYDGRPGTFKQSPDCRGPLEYRKMLGLVSLGLIVGILSAEALIRLSASGIAEQVLRCLRAITFGI